MARLWDKLNLGEHREMLLINAPDTFAAELKTLKGVRVQQRIAAIKEITFALAFVERQKDLDKLSAAIVAKATGDALLWIAYPKATSTRYACDFNRDKGWDVLRMSGFDCVRQVAIDEDWSALRFRRNEFINRRSG